MITGMDQMTLDPQLQKFIDEEVRKGHFASSGEVIAAGVARLMLDPAGEDLDDTTLAAIERAEQAIDQGKGRSFEDVAAEVRSLYKSKNV
jgi:Arc/MetJ-type ribon-helix-helix transcriptional regulator